jgi:hypothetical protein
LEPEKFHKSFPHLTDENYKPTSKATPEPPVAGTYFIYNCFAFVVNDETKFWWPGDDEYSYWPHLNAPDTVQELMSVLEEDFNYEECADGSYEKGVQKIAIFVNGGDPVHIAIQPPHRSGIWKSKMQCNIDMEHDSLGILETWPEDDPSTQGYGKAMKFMRLRKSPKKK